MCRLNHINPSRGMMQVAEGCGCNRNLFELFEFFCWDGRDAVPALALGVAGIINMGCQ